MRNPITSTTGHSRFQERIVAKQLYIAIAVTIVIGMLIFLGIGQRDNLAPSANPTAPIEAQEQQLRR